MKLLVQPGEGTESLIRGIHAARKSIDIVIFRFDRGEIERALAGAVHRGVAVRALIAHTNRAGEESLRQLEMRMLEAGVVVARTADDLVRYHSKFMVVDRRDLYVLAFNLTYVDIERSRSFGVITRSARLVHEALQLFEADVQRRPYEGGVNGFVVSPWNARKQLARFIRGARQELLVYDPKITDPSMVALLAARAKAGVEIKIIGRQEMPIPGIAIRKLTQMRLHTRTMIRDGGLAFVGSQSLREVELDERREVGVIFRDAASISRIRRTFEDDWTAAGQTRIGAAPPAERVARKVAKAVARELPPLAPVLNGVVKEVVGEGLIVDVNADEMQDLVKDAIKEAVKVAVMDVVEEAVKAMPE